MKNLFKISVITQLLFAIYSCKEDKPTPPVVATIVVSEITATTAKSGGTIFADGGSPLLSCGVCWTNTREPTIIDPKTTDALTAGSFASSILNLKGGTVYYVRAYATNSVGTGYGTEMTFTTLGAVPETSSQIATNISTTGATVNGSINANHLSTVVTFEYGTSNSYGQSVTAIQSPVTGNSKTDVSAGVSNLIPGTTYHFRVKAVNDLGTSTGNDLTFTTLGQVPTVSVQPAKTVKSYSATISGIVNANQLATSIILEYGTSTNYGQLGDITPNTAEKDINTVISCNLSGLDENTTYHYRIRAENSLGISYSDDQSFTTMQIVTDIEGNRYQSVLIGTQIWIAENLRTTKLNDGTTIPNIIDDNQWFNLLTPGYAWYNHDANSYKEDYGALYNWHTVNSGKLCPQGWHIPSEDEWIALLTYLSDNIGIKMKESGIGHWVSPNLSTNESGFTGLPGGWRFNGGGFTGLNYYGVFWTSTEFNSTEAFTRNLGYGWGGCDRNNVIKQVGYSVRCLKNK